MFLGFNCKIFVIPSFCQTTVRRAKNNSPSWRLWCWDQEPPPTKKHSSWSHCKGSRQDSQPTENCSRYATMLATIHRAADGLRTQLTPTAAAPLPHPVLVPLHLPATWRTAYELHHYQQQWYQVDRDRTSLQCVTILQIRHNRLWLDFYFRPRNHFRWARHRYFSRVYSWKKYAFIDFLTERVSDLLIPKRNANKRA